MSADGKPAPRGSPQSPGPAVQYDPGEATWVDTCEENSFGEEGRTNSNTTVEVAPQGDLILELSTGGGTVRYKVASQVLCLASPVFSAMLGPSSSFKEATELRAHTSKPYVLPIEDDKPEALVIVLHAFHLQNSKVPPVIEDKEIICHMAIICDKYDCTAALSVWVDIWAVQWERHALRSLSHRHWLFTAWTFGLTGVFTAVSKKIILEGYYGKTGGAFLSKGGWNLDHLAIPSIVMESILQQRKATITAMIKHALYFFDKYLIEGESKPICRHQNPTYDCDLTALGSIVKEYQLRIALYPDHDRFLLMSINDVEGILKNISIRFLGGHAGTCSFLPELFKKITCTVEKIDGLKLESFNSRRGLPARAGTKKIRRK